MLLLLSTFFGRNTDCFHRVRVKQITVILRVIVQIDIHQHFKYGTFSSAYNDILVTLMQTDKTYDHRHMLGNDH